MLIMSADRSRTRKLINNHHYLPKGNHKNTKKMYKNMKLVFTLTVLVLLAGTTTAQLTLTGEFRPRTEYLHGYKTLSVADQDPAFWTEQRTRLNLHYNSEKYRVGLVLQDVRVWGSTSQLNKSDGFSSVHEAWAEYLFTSKFSMKLGRQEVSYDNHRIFGNVDWTQQARSHDMARFQYEDSSNIVNVGLAYNQNSTMSSGNLYTIPNNYKTFQYIYASRKFSKTFRVSILLLNNGMQHTVSDTSVKYSQTGGAYIDYKKNKLGINGGFYFQTGEDETGSSISSSNARVALSYELGKKVIASAGYEFLSGTSQVDTSNHDNNSFSPLYGTNHKFNGYMDYFYVGNHANNVGLQDAFFGLLFKQKRFSAGVDVHMFMTAADLLDKEELLATGNRKAMSPALGTEIDLTIVYKVSDAVSFQGGYSHMVATESMEMLKGGDKEELNNWAYLMFVFKPVLFK